MADPVRAAERPFTYADLKTWPSDERWELIDGVAWDMSPAPSTGHQGISMELSMRFANELRGHPCRAFHAPFDVFLPDTPTMDEDEVTTVVEPDLAVICDRGQLSRRGCWKAPTLVVEILSPSTSAKDMRIKSELYARHGVAEYWIIDPGNQYVHVYLLDDHGAYPQAPVIYVDDATLSPSAPPLDQLELTIPLPELFAAARW